MILLAIYKNLNHAEGQGEKSLGFGCRLPENSSDFSREARMCRPLAVKGIHEV